MDNQQFVATATASASGSAVINSVSYNSNGKITELKGLYTESGFSSVNPDQKPTIGEHTLVRV